MKYICIVYNLNERNKSIKIDLSEKKAIEN